jgi:hypothetical protein
MSVRGQAQWIIVGSYEYQKMVCSGWKESGHRKTIMIAGDTETTVAMMVKEDEKSNSSRIMEGQRSTKGW